MSMIYSLFISQVSAVLYLRFFQDFCRRFYDSVILIVTLVTAAVQMWHAVAVLMMRCCSPSPSNRWYLHASGRFPRQVPHQLGARGRIIHVWRVSV